MYVLGEIIIDLSPGQVLSFDLLYVCPIEFVLEFAMSSTLLFYGRMSHFQLLYSLQGSKLGFLIHLIHIYLLLGALMRLRFLGVNWL